MTSNPCRAREWLVFSNGRWRLLAASALGESPEKSRPAPQISPFRAGSGCLPAVWNGPGRPAGTISQFGICGTCRLVHTAALTRTLSKIEKKLPLGANEYRNLYAGSSSGRVTCAAGRTKPVGFRRPIGALGPNRFRTQPGGAQNATCWSRRAQHARGAGAATYLVPRQDEHVEPDMAGRRADSRR
jgi:hypothetical protein